MGKRNQAKNMQSFVLTSSRREVSPPKVETINQRAAGLISSAAQRLRSSCDLESVWFLICHAHHDCLTALQ